MVVAKANSSFVCYVELKIPRHERSYRELVESVAHLLQAYQLQHRAVVVSFNLAALTYVKEVDAAICTGALFEPRTPTPMQNRSMMIRAQRCGAQEILLHRLMATQRTIESAHTAGLAPVVWTVDDGRWIRRAERLGIHALITNRPAKLIT